MNLYIEVNDSSQLDHWKQMARKYNRQNDSASSRGISRGNIPSPVFIPTTSLNGNPMLEIDMVSKFYIDSKDNSVNVSIQSNFLRGKPSYKLAEFIVADLRTLVRMYASHGA